MAVLGLVSAAVPTAWAVDNTWFELTTYPTARVPWDATAADLTGDGLLDVAVNSAGENVIVVLAGDGAGGLTELGRHGVGPSPATVVAADLDLDGDLDLVAPTITDVSVLLGAGDGTFAAALSVDVGAHAHDAAIGLLDDDDIPDLVVATPFDAAIRVLLGDGAGGFGLPTVVPVGTRGTVSVAIADLDGDGLADVAAGTQELEPVEQDDVATFLGDGHGSLILSQTIPEPGRTQHLVLADMDDDGIVDVVNAGQLGLSIQLGEGDGTFMTALSTAATAYGLAVGDLSGDGDPDVAYTDAVADVVRVHPGRGDGQLLGAIDVADGLQNPQGLTIADLDADGSPDIVAAVGQHDLQLGLIAVLRNTGDVPPPVPLPTPTEGPGPTPTATATEGSGPAPTAMPTDGTGNAAPTVAPPAEGGPIVTPPATNTVPAVGGASGASTALVLALVVAVAAGAIGLLSRGRTRPT